MRRLALLFVALPVAAAACGGGGKHGSTGGGTSARPADPGKAAAAALLRAAQHRDARALWTVLSTPSRKRLGPTFADFKARSAATIEQALLPFETGDSAVFVSQNVSQTFGVVAVRSGSRAIAFPLRNEGGTWKIESPGPVQIRIVSPQPGSTGAVSQVATQVRAPGAIGDADVWVDGRLVHPKVTRGDGAATVLATLGKALPAGVHIAVVYCQAERNAGALAWSFTVAKPG
jgi:hypothetical protein